MEEDVERIGRIMVCARSVWETLQTLDEAFLTERLGPYLASSDMERQIQALVKRQVKLVKHFEKQIKDKGEAQLLFVMMPPPSPEPATN